jgi:hypothetical protein
MSLGPALPEFTSTIGKGVGEKRTCSFEGAGSGVDGGDVRQPAIISTTSPVALCANVIARRVGPPCVIVDVRT